MQPPMTPPIGGLHVPLPDSPMQDSVPGSPGPPQDPPPPSPPPAGIPVQAPGSPMIHWYVAPGTPPWMPQVSMTQGQPPDHPRHRQQRRSLRSRGCRLYGGHLFIQDHFQWQGELCPQGESNPSGGMMPLTMTPTSSAAAYRCRCRQSHRHHQLLRLFKLWTGMMMKTLQRTSRCQHTHGCQLADREHLLLLPQSAA